MEFKHIVIDIDNPRDPHCKITGDIDGDGRTDLLVASASEGGVYWYRAPGWSKHRIATGTFTTDMAVGDIDGDGCLDVVIPEATAGLFWFRNPLGEGRDPASDGWEPHNISPTGAHMHDVEVADLDGDGSLEIVTRHQSGFGSLKGNRVYVWKRIDRKRWEYRTFECPHGEGLELCDIDLDGRKDIVIGGNWYQNPGDIMNGTWTEYSYIDPAHFSTGWTNGDVMVATGDLDGDGHPEIVLSPSEGNGRFSWFHVPERMTISGSRRSSTEPRPWTEHLIASTDHTHGLAVGDVDGDGALEIVIAKMHQATPPQEVAVFRQRNGEWIKSEVLTTTGSHCIRLADIFGTGKLSIYGCNWNNNSPTHGAIELWLAE